MRKCVFLILLVLGLVSVVGGTLHLAKSETPPAALQQGGDPRLVSIQQMPELNGMMCETVPAAGGYTTSLTAALLQRQLGTEQARTGTAPRGGGDVAERPPLRMIHDPYAAFSAVWVDPIRNEVAVADENLFAIMVYDRLDNTPAGIDMTKPKRIIQGRKTNIQFACGIYIDPGTGEIYGLNNDTQDKVVIFGREAQGDVAPDRMLQPPHAPFGIAADEDAGHFYLTIQHSHSVVVYRKGAGGDDDPIRLLQGNRTQLADPHGIALDTKNKLMFVSNHGSVRTLSAGGNRGAEAARQNWPNQRTDVGSGRIIGSSITVYPLDAQGDMEPMRVIKGPRTELNWPIGMAVDPDRKELFVANDAGDSVLVFSLEANGDTAPIRKISGPRSRVKNPTGLFMDLKNNELWVANFGSHSLTVFRPTADGDVAPLRTIRSAPVDEPSLMIGNPGAMAYDTKREELLVAN
jgi:DNA-binding beta-propeller fold protein YncE